MARGQGAQQAGGEVGGIGERIGDGEVTQLLGHQRPSHIAHAQAAFGFGHGQRGQTLGRDFAAHLGRAARIGFPNFAQHFGGCFGHEKTADRVAKKQFVFAEGEVHGGVPDQFLGKPSKRSAMMLRWISLLPA